jgi:KDO2-lipid IV(A) lauroyltransferase
MRTLPARLLHALMWLLQHLPLSILARLGQGLGWLLYGLAPARRRIAERNLALCFPQWSAQHRRQVVQRHFQWVGRSILERALLWHAPIERLKRLIHVEGDVGLAERSTQPVMWLVLHFTGLEVAGAGVQLFQTRHGVDIYTEQTNPYWTRVLKKGRLRFGRGEAYARDDSIRPVIRRIKEGCAFFNMPDMDFGARDAAFVPFFGIPAATLLAPSRMARSLNMLVQPLVVDMLPGGQGWRLRCLPPLENFPTDDPLADTHTLNRWIETQVLANPEQYLWVHKRFKTRPPGEASLYDSPT